MVEKTKKIVHKNQRPGEYGDTRCGVFFVDSSMSTTHKSWRGVTCKRCLRSKPKK